MLSLGFVAAAVFASVSALPQAVTPTASVSASASASGGPTYTLPIELVAQFAGTDALPPATQISGSGSASASGAMATFTAAQSDSEESAVATLIVAPTAAYITAVDQDSQASATLMATQSCSWGTTLTTTVIQPTPTLDVPSLPSFSAITGDFTANGANQPPISAVSTASASQSPYTMTGYLANCVENDAAQQAGQSTVTSSSYQDIAVLATFSSDGYFYWASTATPAGTLVSGSASASATASSR